jgi:hypothetical protein
MGHRRDHVTGESIHSLVSATNPKPFTMKVVSFHKTLPITDPESFLDLTADQPLPGPHDLLVEVRAISVNPVDTKIRAGSGPGKPQGKVLILGWDAANMRRAHALVESGKTIGKIVLSGWTDQ